MILLVLFAIVMMVLSCIMIISPNKWSQGIITFSNKPYFHLFEVTSRLGFGVIFITLSPQTLYPQMFFYIGLILLFVGCGLMLLTSAKHRQFALWSATAFLHTFRIAGCCSFLFGGFLFYAVIYA